MMKKLLAIFLLCFLSAFTYVTAQGTFLDNKRNLCFINYDKVKAPNDSVFNMNAVAFGNFTQNNNFLDAVFLDINSYKLKLATTSGSLSMPQYPGNILNVYYHPMNYRGNVVSADFNSDGKRDFAMVNAQSDILTFRNTNGIIFPKDSIPVTLSSSAMFAKLLVTNNDNVNGPDLITIGSKFSPVPGYYYSVRKNMSASSGTLSFISGSGNILKTTTTTPTGIFDAASIDLDKNGYDEIIFVSEDLDSITIAYNLFSNLTQGYSFSPAIPGIKHKKVKSYDVNNDGIKEITILGKLGPINYVHVYSPVYTNSVLTYLNPKGTATFLFEPNDFCFSDVNKDGLSDLIVNSVSTNSVMVYMHDNQNLFNFISPAIPFNLQGHISGGLTAADVDLNQREEIVSFGSENLTSLVMLKNFTYLDSLVPIGYKTKLCAGDTIVLNNRLQDFFFNYLSTFSPSTALTNPGHIKKITSPGTYSVVATYPTFFVLYPSCTVTSNPLAILPGQTPTIEVSGPNKVCEGESATLTASGAVSYTWSGGSTASSIVLTPTAPVQYSVNGVSADGCYGTMQTGTVELYPSFAATITSDKSSLCINESANLMASSGMFYIWDNGSTNSSIVITQTSTAIQTYTVYVINSEGCSDSAYYQTVVNTDCKKEVTVKSGVTPNNDGKNDFFYIENIEIYPENTVKVFNRWGTLMYSEKGYNNNDKVWPQQNKSSDVLPGTYYYVVDLGNKEPVKKGWIEILGN